MHFRENKELIIKRAVFVVLIVFTAVLQNTKGLFPTLFNVPPMLLIPLTVCIAMFENDMGGMLFGLLSGVVWDVYASRIDGFYAIILVSAGYACSFLLARYLQNNFVTATVFSALVSLVSVTLYWLIFVLAMGSGGAGILYAKYYLVSAAYTTALTPLYYFFVRMLAMRFKKEVAPAAEERLDEKL